MERSSSLVKGTKRKDEERRIQVVGACFRLEVGSYLETFEHALNGINVYGFKDTEMEISITEMAAKSLVK